MGTIFNHQHAFRPHQICMSYLSWAKLGPWRCLLQTISTLKYSRRIFVPFSSLSAVLVRVMGISLKLNKQAIL
jgi:hypothetical protein